MLGLLSGALIFLVCALCASTTYNVGYYLPKYLNNRVQYYVYGDGQLSS